MYSEEFRRARVAEYESGEYTVLEICKLYGISNPIVYRWIYKYSTYNKNGYKIVEESSSKTRQLKELSFRIAELERALGQKQMQLDHYETIIELAKQEYGIDLKKNSNTPQSDK